MMNINLNLLPPFKKKRLDYLVNFLFIKGILEAVIIVAAVLATISVWSWLILQESFNDLVDSASRIDKENVSYSHDVRKINQILADLNASSWGYTKTGPLLIQFITSLPPNIKLNSIQLSRQDQTFVINGVAQARVDFLNFQETLKGIPWINNVVTPASQLFQKENINFEFKANLKGVPGSRAAPPQQIRRAPMED